MRKFVVLLAVLFLVGCINQFPSPPSPIGQVGEAFDSRYSAAGNKLIVEPQVFLPSRDSGQFFVRVRNEDFVWRNGYYWIEGTNDWVPFAFSDYAPLTNAAGKEINWTKTGNKEVNRTFSISDASFGNTNVFIVYGCKWISSTKSFDCNNGKWMYYNFTRITSYDYNADVCTSVEGQSWIEGFGCAP